MSSTLTFRQERFVFEYLKDQNASAAAARAGYTAKNMASQGNELMSNPAIRDRVRIEMQSLLAEIRCSALDLLKQRKRAAFLDPGKLLDGWEPVPLEDLDEETRASLEVSTVLRKSGPVIRVKQSDRHKALRALERLHERVEKLNQQYYAQLQKEGGQPSLEEIEAMDGGGVEMTGGDISEKDQVLSGSKKQAEAATSQIFEKNKVLSGSAKPVEMTVVRFSEIHQVLSGSRKPPHVPPHARGGVARALDDVFAAGVRERGRPQAARDLLAA